MKEQSSGRKSQYEMKSIRDYNMRKNAQLELFQQFIRDANLNELTQQIITSHVVEIKQSAPNPTIQHQINVISPSNQVFISAGNVNNINKLEQFFEGDRNSLYEQPRVTLNDLLEQNRSAWNFGQPQLSQSMRIFNPYIVQQNIDQQYSCNCHQLMCSTKQCGCFDINKRCNSNCRCNARKCMNHEHQMDSDDDDDQMQIDSKQSSNQSDKSTMIKFNTDFVPADLSPYTN